MTLWLAVSSAHFPVTPGLILFPLQRIVEYLRLETITEVYLGQSSHPSTQRSCPDNFWISQKLYSLLPLHHPVPVFHHPQSSKGFLVSWRENLLCFSLLLFPLLLILHTASGRSLTQFSSLYFFRIYVHWQDISWDCSFPVPPLRWGCQMIAPYCGTRQSSQGKLRFHTRKKNNLMVWANLLNCQHKNKT